MSKIFTDAEMESLNNRLSGTKTDKTGIFSARVKPKIKEILNVWLPKKKQLQKAVETKPNKGSKL